ncbi:MAG: EF-hand domain-containing protein [Candidatus Ozemobacteraceae bacterium]
MKKNVLTMFFLVCTGLAQPPAVFSEVSALPAEQLESPYSSFSGEQETQKMHSSASELNNLRNVSEIPPVFAKSLPPYSGQALADFVLSIRNSFVTFVGSSEGRMTKSQFDRLVDAGCLPSRESGQTFFDAHDKDKDGTLTIAEFTPPVSELLQSFEVVSITDSFIRGLPYPNKSNPISTPFLSPGAVDPSKKSALYLSVEEVEQRIRHFAKAIEGETVRKEDGKLFVKDPSGKIIPFPPGLIPLSMSNAEKELKAFALKVGGTLEIAADGHPFIKNSSGNIIPINRWPPHLRPPYLPPKTDE